MADNQLSFLSWNVEGLNEEFLGDRTRLAMDIIRDKNPHVLFLQEIVSKTERMLVDLFSDEYHIVSGYVPLNPTPKGDYLITLIRKDVCQSVDNQEVVRQESAQGPKYYIVVECDLRGVPMVLINCHLDSTQYNYQERRGQMKELWNAMLSQKPLRNVLLGGDTNLRDRDKLDSAVGGVPSGVTDIWEQLGSDPHTGITWDTVNNFNAANLIPEPSEKRFDRFFIVHNLGRKRLKPSGFELIGKETVPDGPWHVSDHWGIVAHLEVL